MEKIIKRFFKMASSVLDDVVKTKPNNNEKSFLKLRNNEFSKAFDETFNRIANKIQNTTEE